MTDRAASGVLSALPQREVPVGLRPGDGPPDGRPESGVGQMFVGWFPTSLSRGHTFHSCGEQQEGCVLC